MYDASETDANEADAVVMADFPDHFSKVANEYSAYRPPYPPELFEALVNVVGPDVAQNGLVWECAAGSGQASLALGDRFGNVLATDASIAQLLAAPEHPRVRYAAAKAESCPLRSGSVALVAVAQALHWFSFDAFYSEVKRVLQPNGVIAVWSYGLLRAETNPALDAALTHFCDHTLSGWWPKERRYVDEAYATLPFPLTRIAFPTVQMTASWTRAQLTGYLGTWSAVTKKRAADGVDPLLAFEPILAEAWGEAVEVMVNWPLTILVGRQ